LLGMWPSPAVRLPRASTPGEKDSGEPERAPGDRDGLLVSGWGSQTPHPGVGRIRMRMYDSCIGVILI
jgi:hypothetical protein